MGWARCRAYLQLGLTPPLAPRSLRCCTGGRRARNIRARGQQLAGQPRTWFWQVHPAIANHPVLAQHSTHTGQQVQWPSARRGRVAAALRGASLAPSAAATCNCSPGRHWAQLHRGRDLLLPAIRGHAHLWQPRAQQGGVQQQASAPEEHVREQPFQPGPVQRAIGHRGHRSGPGVSFQLGSGQRSHRDQLQRPLGTHAARLARGSRCWAQPAQQARLDASAVHGARPGGGGRAGPGRGRLAQHARRTATPDNFSVSHQLLRYTAPARQAPSARKRACAECDKHQRQHPQLLKRARHVRGVLLTQQASACSAEPITAQLGSRAAQQHTGHGASAAAGQLRREAVDAGLAVAHDAVQLACFVAENSGVTDAAGQRGVPQGVESGAWVNEAWR